MILRLFILKRPLALNPVNHLPPLIIRKRRKSPNNQCKEHQRALPLGGITCNDCKLKHTQEPTLHNAAYIALCVSGESI